MDQCKLRQRLRRHCTGFNPDEWPILVSLFAADDRSLDPTLAEHCERDPMQVARVLAGRGVAGWAMQACPDLRKAPEPLCAALLQAAQYELATCAQRKMALYELDALARDRQCELIIVKGAANATAFYDKEAFRPSCDIDIIMPVEAMAHCFQDRTAIPPSDAPQEQWFQLPEFRMAGYPVEVHGFLIAPSQWGTYADLAENSLPLAGFSCLKRPDAQAAFTIALLHFMHHEGGFFFDFLDVMHIARSAEFRMDKAVELWKTKGIVHLVLPGLAVANSLTPILSGAEWQTLFDSLDHTKQREAIIAIRLLPCRRLTKLRQLWFRSILSGPSFLQQVSRSLLGTREVTQELTGLPPGHPLFWLLHCFGLPMKRIASFWK